MKILMFMVFALVSTNVFAGEVIPQQSGVPMTDPQGFPTEIHQGEHFVPAPQGEGHFPPPQGNAPFPAPTMDGHFPAPQGNAPFPAPLGTPFTAPAPHGGVPHGAPVVGVPHPQTPCNNGVAPQPAQPGLAPLAPEGVAPVAPQQGLVPQS